MKILMMTNTYTPIVGGVEESIRSFSAEFEKLGHEVIIVAPEAEGAPLEEKGVVRLRAIKNIYNTNFSIALPLSNILTELMETFKPDIVHSNHPFWMGDIALRLCSKYQLPLVFTYHTMFEQHMHYLPTQNEKVKRFMVELFIGYANLANQVIAPSESVRKILLERGVKTPVEAVPTGINLGKFSKGEGAVIRKRFNIPPDARVIGYLGRLAKEKNIEFLCLSIAAYLKKEPKAHFLLAGKGPMEDEVKNIFKEKGLAQHLHLAGVVHGQELIDCYYAMDVFAFSSVSETQGIVLIEAMAAGVPVVAVDAPGIREVVKDGYNGRLLYEESRNNFVEALSWCLNQPPSEFQKLKQNARETAKEFSIELSAQKMLKVYQDARKKEYVSPERKDSSWFSLVDRFKTEWDMFTNMIQAGAGAVTDKPADSPGPNKRIQKKQKGLLARLPRLLSLSEWTGKLLNLSRASETEIQAGLVIIQIDGLSKAQLEKAFDKNEMPFLKGLFKNQFYKLHPFYPGVPSSTPSIQGELLYGVKQIVPAFSFLDKESSKVFRMYDSVDAVEIERRLALQAARPGQGGGLLEGGSSYSNIFSGGAKESHFCANILGWGELWNNIKLVNSVILILTHIPFFIRMTVLILWEIVLGLIQFVRGMLNGENFVKEWHFIYLRPLICIFLREFVVFGSKIDIMRGLPIIHLNLLGYDELSHNSGPSSKSAHWALKGIDGAIENIYRTALHAPRRNYDVWIYSDHGQEETVHYVKQNGRNVHEAIAEVFKEFDADAQCVPAYDKNGEQLHRARLLGFSFIEKLFPAQKPNLEGSAKLIVTAFGPTGNIYLPCQITKEQKYKFGRALVEKAGLPVVLFPEELDQVRVWTQEGEFILPQAAEKIIGEDHPYLKEVTRDLIHLCHHTSAGDFTFMGHRPGHKPMSFPIEHGSHAGPGIEETNAFALLPVDALKIPSDKKYLTPMDLRLEAFNFLKVPGKIFINRRADVVSVPFPETIRILTYNVHSCTGMDGKISPERIARVISRHKPDIVALQELDVLRLRTGGIDQPHVIAEQLEMIYHFHPSFQIEKERYGNAVLSRYPMELIRAGRLSSGLKNPGAEERGAIWSAINIAGLKINFFNTHLGLFPWERSRQINILLETEWISHPDCSAPVILCGDFNFFPGSKPYRNVNKVLHDAQKKLDNHNPQATWFGHYPIGRIDHVFVSPEIEVINVKVSRTDLDKISSDHLPLIVDIQLNKRKKE